MKQIRRIIERCSQCAYVYSYRGLMEKYSGYYCIHGNGPKDRLDDPDTIPPDCPLEDVAEDTIAEEAP